MAPNIDYVARVNRAVDHVLAHLDEALPLERVAKVAAFSPYHFHRVFKALMGETLHAFVKRVRLDRALLAMEQGERSLSRIALDHGFASPSDFSRSFKQRFGASPSAFDLVGHRRAGRAASGARYRLERLPPGSDAPGLEVVIRALPPRRLAYLRVLRPYEPGRVVDAAARLVGWAEARGCADSPWYGYQWDDPDLVDHALCRYDVAVEIDQELAAQGEVGRLDLPAMTVAEIALDGDLQLEQRALDWLYETWLPSSGWAPDDHPCFEAWDGRPFAHGTERFTLRVQLPVRER